MNTIEEDAEIEDSPLSGTVSQYQISVELRIYRIAGSSDGWSLEVVDREGTSTVWDETFPTDQDAYREFHKALETEGISAFLADSGATKH
jgi:hypothetical protein